MAATFLRKSLILNPSGGLSPRLKYNISRRNLAFRTGSATCSAHRRRWPGISHNLENPKCGTLYWNSCRSFHVSIALNADHVLTAPPFAESVTEGDIRWEKAVGDGIAIDEVVCEIETDKTSVPVPSPVNGVLEEQFVPDGTTVKAGQKLGRIKAGDAPPKKETAPAETKTAETAKPPTRSETTSAAPTQPEIPTLIPTPPATPSPAPSSRPIPVAAIRHAQALEAATVNVPPQNPQSEITGTRSEQRVKMSRMRLRIAERLKDAQNTTAMLTTFNEIDMSNIIAFRKKHLEAFTKKYGLKLGFMSPFLKAAAYALQDQPVVNACIDGNEIIYRDYIDISVAVATPKGLVVPVVRNVEQMNYADIEKAIAALGEKARKGMLAVEDMDGGTFTVSNGGVFGSLMGTPIINPPQSAILGMHGTFERPIALDGQVVIRPMMYVALTYDHRLIDGREAVLFLRKIKAGIEDPTTILAGL